MKFIFEEPFWIIDESSKSNFARVLITPNNFMLSTTISTTDIYNDIDYFRKLEQTLSSSSIALGFESNYLIDYSNTLEQALSSSSIAFSFGSSYLYAIHNVDSNTRTATSLIDQNNYTKNDLWSDSLTTNNKLMQITASQTINMNSSLAVTPYDNTQLTELKLNCETVSASQTPDVSATASLIVQIASTLLSVSLPYWRSYYRDSASSIMNDLQTSNIPTSTHQLSVKTSEQFYLELSSTVTTSFAKTDLIYDDDMIVSTSEFASDYGTTALKSANFLISTNPTQSDDLISSSQNDDDDLTITLSFASRREDFALQDDIDAEILRNFSTNQDAISALLSQEATDQQAMEAGILPLNDI